MMLKHLVDTPSPTPEETKKINVIKHLLDKHKEEKKANKEEEKPKATSSSQSKPKPSSQPKATPPSQSKASSSSAPPVTKPLIFQKERALLPPEQVGITGVTESFKEAYIKLKISPKVYKQYTRLFTEYRKSAGDAEKKQAYSTNSKNYMVTTFITNNYLIYFKQIFILLYIEKRK